MRNKMRFLLRKPWIMFVTTPLALVIAKLYGANDGKRKRIRAIESKVYSPHLEKVAHHALSYQNRTYLKLLKLLREPFVEVRRLSQELDNISGDAGHPQVLHNSLSKRQLAHMDSQSRSSARRKQEIMLRLSELKQELQHVDLSLDHHIERSINEVNRYYSSYCKGAMASVESEVLRTTIFDRTPVSKVRYDQEMKEILGLCTDNTLKVGYQDEAI